MREFAVWQDVRYVCRVCHVCIGDVKMHGGNKSTTTKLTNDTRTEIPVVADDLDELSVALLASAVGFDKDRQRLSDTDGVRELDKGSTGKASSDQRLGDPSSGVSGRTINLGEVLS